MLYTVDNTQPGSKVLLNGREVSHVVMADTSKGKLVRCRTPLRADKWRKRVLRETLRGHVEVITFHASTSC